MRKDDHMSILKIIIKQTQLNHIKAIHVSTLFKLKDIYFVNLMHYST